MALNRWEPRQAVESLLRARELDPDMCGLHTALGIAFQLMDDFDRAEAEYTLGLRTNPNDSFLYSGLGMLYLDKARKSRSLTLAYRALGMFMRASFTRTNHVSLKPLAAATLKLIAKLRAGRS